jgi:hypothetical protein
MTPTHLEPVPPEQLRQLDSCSVAHRMNGEEREIIELGQSGAFTLEKLRSDVAALRLKRKNLRG